MVPKSQCVALLPREWVQANSDGDQGWWESLPQLVWIYGDILSHPFLGTSYNEQKGEAKEIGQLSTNLLFSSTHYTI